MERHCLQRLVRASWAAALVWLIAGADAWAQSPAGPLSPFGQETPAGRGAPEQRPAAARPSASPLAISPLVHKLTETTEHQEMTVNTSRILTLDARIPQAQVNNPDIVELTPLSPNQIQLSAKKPGVTQVNFWDEKGQIYSVDVMVFGDARELTQLLQSEFPHCSLRIRPITGGVLISGFVDQPEHVRSIVQIAQEYYPKVLQNMTVGGAQQVQLHVKVMEVSRTKLRELGFDFAQLSGNNIAFSGVSGLLTGVTAATSSSGSYTPPSMTTASNNMFFQVVNGNNAFFGVLQALRQDNLMKVMADPTLVTVSGRPAKFHAGGSIPIPQPSGLGTVSYVLQPYGTTLDFVPIVLGNGKIRLEVRPEVSEIDPSVSVSVQGTSCPGLLDRGVDTGVEMQAGQTLAIAGLVQTRIESQRREVPWLGELPYIGALFRSVQDASNEIECLILVTPELVEAMDAEQVPPCGPGMETTEPTDVQLFFEGHLEVPNCCPASPSGPGVAQPSLMQGQGPMAQGPAVERVEAVPSPPPSAPARWTTPPAAAPQVPQPQPSPPANPSARYNPNDRQNQAAATTTTTTTASGSAPRPLPTFLGPTGYDVSP
jgi:pilus assembly protein CpaC